MFKKVLCFVTGALLLFILTGCGKDELLDRSLIFSTYTTIGVEVAVSPAEPSGPARIIIGFKRAEGVINPVYHSEGVKETTTAKDGTITEEIDRYRPEAYSVIAKLHGEVGTEAGAGVKGKLSVAQWFATGQAANNITNQPVFAATLTDSPKVAEEVSKSIQAEERAKQQIEISNDAKLRSLKTEYRQLTKEATFATQPPDNPKKLSPEDYANNLANTRVPGETAEGIMTHGPLEDARAIVEVLEKYVKQ